MPLNELTVAEVIELLQQHPGHHFVTVQQVIVEDDSLTGEPVPTRYDPTHVTEVTTTGHAVPGVPCTVVIR